MDDDRALPGDPVDPWQQPPPPPATAPPEPEPTGHAGPTSPQSPEPRELSEMAEALGVERVGVDDIPEPRGVAVPNQQVLVGRRSKVVAGLLALFLGGIGIHKFYLGRIGWGVAYLLLSWTLIPAIVAFVEAIVYFASDDARFAAKYG